MDSGSRLTRRSSRGDGFAVAEKGTLVILVGDTLNMTCSQGKHHSYTVAKDAKVTCDSHASKAADLKAGTHVRVTTHKDDKTVATGVESGKLTPATPHKA